MTADIDLDKRMAAWRASKGLTLQEVSDVSGVTKQMLSLVELGESDMTVGKLHRVCVKAFDITLTKFFGPLPTKRQERAA